MEVINKGGLAGPGTGTVAQWLIDDAVKTQGKMVNREKYLRLKQFCEDFDKLVAKQELLDYSVELVDEDTNIQFSVTVPGVFEEVPRD